MSDWRDRLVQALKEKGLDMKAASLGADLNETAVQQISKGNDPKTSTILKLAQAHGLSLDEVLLNRPHSSTASQAERPVRLAAVVGTVAAGLWFSTDAPPQVEAEPVPYVPCRYPDLEQTAYKVQGNSMDKARLDDGDFVITVPYWDARIAPTQGDIAVVERTRDGGLSEWTVKEIEVTREAIHLRPRSSDPKHETLTIPRINRADMYDAVRIVGLVVGKFSPI